jgi:hypothetical protein
MYPEVLQILKKLEQMEEMAKHPLLLNDLAQKELLYVCLYKNLMSADSESQKL